MLAKIDTLFCDFAQAAYLYLLDRFGVRVGDVVCVLTLAHSLAPRSVTGYAAAFVCISLGCFIAGLQRAGQHEAINRAAELMRSQVILRFALIAFAAFNVAAGRHPAWDEAVNVLLVYLLTCKVRDRDEDRFRKTQDRTSWAPEAG